MERDQSPDTQLLVSTSHVEVGLAARTVNVHQNMTIYAGQNPVPPTPGDKLQSRVVGVETEKMKILGNATFYTGCTIPPKPEIKFPIRFNIQDPVESFFGRQLFLDDLHRAIQESASSNKMTVLSQLKIMSGLGGVGKTETTRKYILDYISFYENVIWINADNTDTLTASFLRLAQNDLKISTKNEEGKPRDLKTIMAEIYQIICTKVTLLIFDNADGVCSQDFDHQKNLKPFLPPSILPPLLRPFILITSRRQDWGSFSRQVLTLNVFTEDESMTFILQQLELDDRDEKNRTDARDLGHLLGHLPLALQQAVAYIREETLKGLLYDPKGFSIQQYIETFRLEPSRKDLLDHPLEGLEFDYEWTVFTTWRITMKKIRESAHYGPLAVKIVEILSFLYADNTPAKLLFAILKNSTPLEISTSVSILRKYSMIQHRIAEQFLVIHRLVQKVNLEDLKLEPNGIEQIFSEIVSPCNDFLLKLPLSDTNYGEVLQGLKSLVGNLNLLPNPKTIPYLGFKVEVSAAFREAGSYDEASGLAKETFLLRNELLGQDHPDTLHTADLLASILQCQGRYDEAKKLVDEIGQGWKTKFGSDHRAALLTQNNSGILLCRQGKYEEALKEFEEAHKGQEESLGPGHQDTVNSLHNMAIVLKNLGRYPQSVKIYEEVLQLEIENGHDHILTIRTRYNMAIALECQGKLEEALELFNKVHDQRKELMGPKHVDVIKTQVNIAMVQSQLGKNEEAFKMLESAFKQMKNCLGTDHIDTLMTGQRLAKVLRELKRFDEALILLEQTRDSLLATLQNDSHPAVLETLDEIGGVLGDLGRLDEALGQLELVFERREKCHGKQHPATQKTERTISHLRSVQQASSP